MGLSSLGNLGALASLEVSVSFENLCQHQNCRFQFAAHTPWPDSVKLPVETFDLGQLSRELTLTCEAHK